MYRREFMEIAVDEARKGIANHDGGPFGAVVVKDGEVIAAGHNRVLSNNDSTCHGEIDAIRKAEERLCSYDLSGCEIYTTGEPCPMCLAAILWANIGRVYYGCSLADNERIGFRDVRIDEMMGGRTGDRMVGERPGDDKMGRRASDEMMDGGSGSEMAGRRAGLPEGRSGLPEGFMEERDREMCLEVFREYEEMGVEGY